MGEELGRAHVFDRARLRPPLFPRRPTSFLLLHTNDRVALGFSRKRV